MKSHQFPSFQSAIDYCKDKGELQYWGREWIRGAESKCIYTLTIGRVIWDLWIYDNGLVEVEKERRVN